MNQEMLHKHFYYSPSTGVFRWRSPTSRCHKEGDVAGSIDNRGYRRIGLSGRRYVAHRLAWIYCYGEIPEGMEINHVREGGSRDDNRIWNLTLATPRQNCTAYASWANTRELPTGVVKHRGKYMAQAWLNGKHTYLGTFASPDEAALTYQNAIK